MHFISGSPYKSAYAATSLRRSHHHPTVVDVVRAAAGISGQDAQILHGSVFPQKSPWTSSGIRYSGNHAKTIHVMGLTGCAAERSQILNLAIAPEHGMASGCAGNLALIIDGRCRAGI